LAGSLHSRGESRLTSDVAPALSVVLVTPASYQRIRKTMNHLQSQSLRARMEVIIVCPSLAELDADHEDWQDFYEVRCIEVGVIRSTGEVRAAGALEARADVVAFAEDHCFPGPGWAEALVEAHRGTWAGVGATMTNANPASLLSWADLFLNFGPCVMRKSGGAAHFIPWHNSSYPKAALLEYGDDLARMLEVEGVLHIDQERRGRELFLCAAATTDHINISRFDSFLSGHFWGGRMFWAALIRKERWPAWKRLGLAVASPALGLIRIERALREMRRAGKLRRLLPAVLPALCAGALAISFGALAGAMFGSGDAASHRISVELYRDRHLREADRSLLTA
jgi:hypothetical protein